MLISSEREKFYLKKNFPNFCVSDNRYQKKIFGYKFIMLSMLSFDQHFLIFFHYPCLNKVVEISVKEFFLFWDKFSVLLPFNKSYLSVLIGRRLFVVFLWFHFFLLYFWTQSVCCNVLKPTEILHFCWCWLILAVSIIPAFFFSKCVKSFAIDAKSCFASVNIYIPLLKWC